MGKNVGIRAAGGTLMTVAIGMFASGWSDLIRPHPYWVVGLAVVGAFLFIYPWVAKSLPPPESRPWEHLVRDSSGKVIIGTAEAVSGNVAGRDNSGHQIHNAPGGTVIIGDGNAASPQWKYTGIDIQPSPVQSKKPSPKLRWAVAFDQVEYVSKDAAWRRFDRPWANSNEALIFGITNPMPRPDEIPLEISDLAAHITFTSFLSTQRTVETVVSRSYWVGEPSNEVSLDVGETGRIVACVREHGKWVSYANSRRDVPQLSDPFYDPFFPVGERIHIPTEEIFGNIQIEIILYSSSLGRAVEVKKFGLRMVATGRIPPRYAGHSWAVRELHET